MSAPEICYQVLNRLYEISNGNPRVQVYSTVLSSIDGLDEDIIDNCIGHLESEKFLTVLRPRPSGINYDLISITTLGIKENLSHYKTRSIIEIGDQNTNHIFISYAKEDYYFARKFYDDLTNLGYDVWLDKESILPGQNWEIEIPEAVRKSKYFIPLFSKSSVSKRGYVQREFRIALEVALEIPEGEIFIVPLRLDNCKIPFEQLRKIQYQDMFPDWNIGISRILRSIKPSLTRKMPIQPKILKSAVSPGEEESLVSIVYGASALSDNAFQPNPIVVKVGQTITWRNDDSAFHTVTSGIPGDPNSGVFFDSGLAGPNALTSKGKKFSVTFYNRGEYPYYCILHPRMNGRIIVE